MDIFLLLKPVDKIHNFNLPALIFLDFVESFLRLLEGRLDPTARLILEFMYVVTE